MRLFVKNIAVTDLRSLPKTLPNRFTAVAAPNVVPSTDRRHNVPSAKPVYKVPDNMNAPRAWAQATFCGDSDDSGPSLVPSKVRLLAVSSVRVDDEPQPPTERVFVPT